MLQKFPEALRFAVHHAALLEELYYCILRTAQDRLLTTCNRFGKTVSEAFNTQFLATSRLSTLQDAVDTQEG